MYPKRLFLLLLSMVFIFAQRGGAEQKVSLKSFKNIAIVQLSARTYVQVGQMKEEKGKAGNVLFLVPQGTLDAAYDNIVKKLAEAGFTLADTKVVEKAALARTTFEGASAEGGTFTPDPKSKDIIANMDKGLDISQWSADLQEHYNTVLAQAEKSKEQQANVKLPQWMLDQQKDRKMEAQSLGLHFLSGLGQMNHEITYDAGKGLDKVAAMPASEGKLFESAEKMNEENAGFLGASQCDTLKELLESSIVYVGDVKGKKKDERTMTQLNKFPPRSDKKRKGIYWVLVQAGSEAFLVMGILPKFQKVDEPKGWVATVTLGLVAYDKDGKEIGKLLGGDISGSSQAAKEDEYNAAKAMDMLKEAVTNLAENFVTAVQ